VATALGRRLRCSAASEAAATRESNTRRHRVKRKGKLLFRCFRCAWRVITYLKQCHCSSCHPCTHHRHRLQPSIARTHHRHRLQPSFARLFFALHFVRVGSVLWGGGH
jgi:hypothetical protein